MQDYLTSDGLRAAIVFVLAIGQAAAAYWPDIRKWDNTITSRSQNLDTPVVPFGPFFAIWLVIFASCFGFAIWHALPSNLDDPYLRQVGWVAAALFAGNIAWEAYVPRFGFKWPSFLLLLVELAIALTILTILQPFVGQLTGWAYWLGAAPLYFFAGWVSVATFVSLSSTMVLTETSLDPREAKTAAGMLVLAGVFVAIIAFWTGSAVYIVSAIWGLLGVVVGSRIKKDPVAATVAATTSIGMILLALGAS